MSIPGLMMPGGGGAGPGGPSGPGGPGAPPGGPGGGIESLIAMLNPMQKQPPQSGEENLFRDASAAVGQVYARVAQRSAKAAQLLSECLTKINQARQELQKEPTAPLAAPPDLGLGGGMGAPAPTMPMPGAF